MVSVVCRHVVTFFAMNDFFVVIDDHGAYDLTFVEQGTSAWVSQWINLLGRLNQNADVRRRLIVDPLNEPGRDLSFSTISNKRSLSI